ncbi:hypothetical protein QLH32_02465 [Acinetobacter corruptisaponis]|uniref:Uncharacterized protein n=1 Tax=Acinetobacter corruptisaponis TaxID=3045147 RepID=A0ABY8S5H2_9GAMM|nr:hypothetical protein [Acinetobacter sp. KCTC 92772]WHP06348.1 hypothetical protein QLH32_02465 [Acinetobacter sp. KCTC 92772]
MNAQVQLLTITPEQLKQFEQNRKYLTSSAERTMWTIGQLGTLFRTISEASKADENEEPFKDFVVGDLALIGSLVCGKLFEDAEHLKERLDELSPLNTPNT